MNHLTTVVLLFLMITVVSCSEQKYPGALSPEEALESIVLRDGFDIELFAAEPYVYDPVCMSFDARGNIYVVEMPDYPYRPEPGQARGRIRMLSDTDGDGRIDKASVFADSLSEATSVLPWKEGLLVTTAPLIVYLKDTNGDAKADTKEVLFKGFFDDNSEAQITSLRFGIDNWIYAANNGQPGEVSFTRQPDAPALAMRGADFRFRLDKGLFELATGPGQFGQALDDWGHRFMTQNTLHIRQAVLPKRYAARNPHLPADPSPENISDHELMMYQLTPPPYWRAERTRRRNKRYDKQNMDRTEYADDHFTGASGGTFYAGDAFPEEYYGNIFTGDVAGNLVHRDVLTPLDDSPTFVASRGEGEKTSEFLASTDPWFRPANFTVGPDGYLYVIDMYRQHIETPVSIPEDLKAEMDFLNGSKHGRIYRIVPENASSGKESPSLKDFQDITGRKAQEYVALLDHPNRWWRLQAQRLLLERQDTSVIPEVKALFKVHGDPRTRLHALYVLEGLHALTTGLVKQAMNDPHPGVREHGLILSERFSELLPELIKSVDDPSSRVAFQATLSLGEFEGDQVVEALAKVVQQRGGNPWFRTAVLSAKAGSSINLIENLVQRDSFLAGVEPWKAAFFEDFAYVIGARNKEEQLKPFLALLSLPAMEKDTWQKAAAAGLTRGLKKAEMADPAVKELLQGVAGNSSKEVIQKLKKLYPSS